MTLRLHLPLALIHLLLQALQVDQEGLVELWQLGILLKTRPELSDTSALIHTISSVRTHTILSASYLQEIHQLFLHADNSRALQFLMGGNEESNSSVFVYIHVEIYGTIFLLKPSLCTIQDNVLNHLNTVK